MMSHVHVGDVPIAHCFQLLDFSNSTEDKDMLVDKENDKDLLLMSDL